MLKKLIHKGGQKVGKGTYWDIRSGHRVSVEHEAVLPGDDSKRYIKAPVIVVLMFGPALGLLYAVFLPFIGIAMTLSLAARKVSGGLANAAAKSVSFGWRPVEAYLTGRKKKKTAPEKKTDNKSDR